MHSSKCREDFERYAFTCFEEFGDRVKNWITFNEPHGFAIQGYDTGLQAPGRCSIFGHVFCKTGQSAVEPYIVAHNILLSHAAAYHSYQINFKVLIFTKKNKIKGAFYNISLIPLLKLHLCFSFQFTHT